MIRWLLAGCLMVLVGCGQPHYVVHFTDGSSRNCEELSHRGGAWICDGARYPEQDVSYAVTSLAFA